MNWNVVKMPCPTCSGPVRETVGMVCQTCGTDYAPAAPAAEADLREQIARELYRQWREDSGGDPADLPDWEHLNDAADEDEADPQGHYRERASKLLALPALQRLVEQAAEAARLRETVARVEDLLKCYPAGESVSVFRLRRALDGTDV